MKKFLILISLLSAIVGMAQNPKWEFRGAWMHTIGQSQYAQQNTEENKAYLRQQLDKLAAAGVNAVLFQVRPCADAFYKSNYELWSKYLTKGGKAPEPYWDPLEFLIEESHARGMELHAWLNPYRVTTVKNEELPAEHLYHREPWRFVKYLGDGKIYFDPALPESQDYIALIVKDIVERYDVDGIHFDDYFYPYPANKKDFPDDKSYAKYGKGMNRGDWRRQNVDKLIEKVHECIRMSSKPWVRFGISPFGIWRNKKSDPRGSETNGLQNYDDLYADVLLWAEKGWIDYLMPQLYWELEHPRASYLSLIEWWANAVPENCHVYIGQDVEKTMDKPDLEPSTEGTQLRHKVDLTREWDTVLGNCWWPAYSVTKNSKGIADALAEDFQSTIALVPSYPIINSEPVAPVRRLRIKDDKLSWQSNEPQGKCNDQVKFVIYRFDCEDDVDFDDASCIMAITQAHEATVEKPGIYYVTSLDRVNNESEPSLWVVKK